MEMEWIELDVRPMLASGREPFALIMNHLHTLGPEQGLRLIAPFYPAPLVDMLAGQGWVAESSQDSQQAWVISLRPGAVAEDKEPPVP